MEFNFTKPTLEIHFLLHIKDTVASNPSLIQSFISDNLMTGLYSSPHIKKIITLDDKEYKRTAQLIQEKIKILEDSKTVENETENEAVDIKIAETYACALEKEKFLHACKYISMKNPSSALNMDIILCKIRLSIILKDKKLFNLCIYEGKQIITRGCDWDRRNKFKVYEALYKLTNRNYHAAGTLFIESLPTFESKELLSYEKTVKYAIYCALISFSRKDLKEKILASSDVLETLKENEVGLKLVDCLYSCNYGSFFRILVQYVAETNEESFLGNTNFFMGEVKIRAYNQLLESYKSLSLDTFAEVFGVSVEFIENDLCNFIVDQRINCVIDRISRLVYVKEKTESYDKILVEKGDVLMRLVKKNIK